MLIQIKCFIIIWHFWGEKKAHIFFVQTSTLILKGLIPAKGASKTKGAIICFSFLPLPQNFDNEQFSILKKKKILICTKMHIMIPGIPLRCKLFSDQFEWIGIT